ncbi:hypothetical protein Fmac_018601 [Flemingia macrophylla]|uniref:Uncharacterized protein n=1 Tax=Flemingia macrophylla TaxID=520843 RepID=A0ABD1M5F1_9FABA
MTMRPSLSVTPNTITLLLLFYASFVPPLLHLALSSLSTPSASLVEVVKAKLLALLQARVLDSSVGKPYTGVGSVGDLHDEPSEQAPHGNQHSDHESHMRAIYDKSQLWRQIVRKQQLERKSKARRIGDKAVEVELDSRAMINENGGEEGFKDFKHERECEHKSEAELSGTSHLLTQRPRRMEAHKAM